MWPDNETDIDFLNFSGVADTVAEIILQANQRPISIGVSGAWGVGKSSMIKLIQASLRKQDEDAKRFLFVEFNAWLYQGYDDVRAALLEVIAEALKKDAESKKTAVGKAKELLGRVNWLRAAKLTGGSAIALSLGLPPVGLLGEILQLGKNVASGKADASGVEKASEAGAQLADEAAGLLKPKADSSPPREIHAIRSCFEETLRELNVTLVVLIDDLDRCLPETSISTLEAIRLFLFLKSTSFVIAADDEMIKHAVRRHFEGVGEKHVTSYFDKLIQVPIRVPPLGTQEVRAYMMLLFADSSSIDAGAKEAVRTQVCEQLGRSWEGKRVDRAFMQTLDAEFSDSLIAQFDTADRLAPLMTTATEIRGNPRLIKRFLNALAIRMAMARANGIGVDEAALAKLLLFERCGGDEAYRQLVDAINADEHGHARFLGAWEQKAIAGEELELENPWDAPFVREWLAVPPRLAELDLRGAIYVSREHTPLISPEDRLSSEGAELLAALLDHPDMAADLAGRLSALGHPELALILDRVLERANQVQEWGVPPILDACLAITRADQSQGRRLAGFLEQRPPVQITAALVPKISSEPWVAQVFEAWSKSDVSKPVKTAIRKQREDGNV
ncbi:MAG: ATPase [Phycisphaerae bacterium]|nr:ATPase [Phycisphaerae bacterium]